MCTAISVVAGNHYFGRNLDYDHTFGEKITITPRRYEFNFTNGQKTDEHYAIIGMALPYKNYPLYFDAVNEAGLAVAGLNFPEYADYKPSENEKYNIASFEFIPWILTSCKTAKEAEILLKKVNITDKAFDEHLKPSPLHFMISDKEKSITIEQTKKGLFIYENPVGVLTNSPTFDIHLFNLRNYLSVSNKNPENRFLKELDLKPYSQGMGGMGLPGDLSSMSRFVKACFTKLNSVYGETEEEIVHQFFHILYSVYQQKGCVCTESGYEITNYTCCCNVDKGIYYYTSYYNSSISAVDMHEENLDAKELIVYDVEKGRKFSVKNSKEK